MVTDQINVQLIEKHDIINTLPRGLFTEPIRQALISLEQTLDVSLLILPPIDTFFLSKSDCKPWIGI